MDLFVDSEQTAIEETYTRVNYGKKICLICSKRSFYKYCKECYSTFTECVANSCSSKCKSKFCSEMCYYETNKKTPKRLRTQKTCKTQDCPNKTIYDLCSLCYERQPKCLTVGCKNRAFSGSRNCTHCKSK